MIGRDDGWGSNNIFGDWGSGPMLKGTGSRKVTKTVNAPPRFASDPDLILFSGISGYLVWTTYERKANGRLAL